MPSQHNHHYSQQDRQRPPPPFLDVSRIRFGDSISADLYADIAEKMANTIADSGDDNEDKKTQLRRFYGELYLWNEKVNARNPNQKEDPQSLYNKFAPLIKMLRAKVAYAKGRRHVSGNFVTLFDTVINQINGPATLKQAKLFMEAFMGFYTATPKGQQD